MRGPQVADPFDEHATDYRDAVQDSIAFCGPDLSYFTRRKVDVLVDLLARHVGPPSGLKVLDAGCGVGVTDEVLVGEVGELHGLDSAELAVAAAIERNPKVSYSTTDGHEFGHPDGVFDATFAICVAHHVEPGSARAGFYRELARVTRPGGLVVVFEHNPLNPLTRLAVSRCEFDEGVVLIGRRALRRDLEAAGLDVVESRHVIFTPLQAAWAQRAERLVGWLPLGAQHVVAARPRYQTSGTWSSGSG
jgi:SAM-dependent methyltransferase